MQGRLDGSLGFPHTVTLAFTRVPDIDEAWAGFSDLCPSGRAPYCEGQLMLPTCEAMCLWQMARQWTSLVKSIVVPPWCELMCSLASLCLGDWATQGQIPEQKAHAAFLQCCVWHVSELPCQISAADMSGSNSKKQNLVCSHMLSLWRFSKVSNCLMAL